jgi:hypothetical protein
LEEVNFFTAEVLSSSSYKAEVLAIATRRKNAMKASRSIVPVLDYVWRRKALF